MITKKSNKNNFHRRSPIADARAIKLTFTKFLFDFLFRNILTTRVASLLNVKKETETLL